MARAAARQGIELQGRITLLEEDMDRMEQEIHQGFQSMDVRFSGLYRVLWGIMCVLLGVLATLAATLAAGQI